MQLGIRKGRRAVNAVASKPFKSLAKQLTYLGLGALVTLGVFMILPILQIITAPPPKDLTVRSVMTASLDAPDPPQMDEEEPEPEPEEVEPPPPQQNPLSLSEMEIALAPGDGGFGGDFTIDIGNVTGGSDEVDKIFSLSDLDQKPRAVYKPSPVYPKELARKGIQGTVYVIFVVDKTGRATNLKVQKSSHPALEKPALNAVKKWKFEPGKSKGKPVKFKMRVPITFQK